MKNLSGEVFGELTVVKPHSLAKKRYWDCLCSCGNDMLGVLEEYLVKGSTTRCQLCKNEQHLENFLRYLEKSCNFQLKSADNFRMGAKTTFICEVHGEFTGTPSVILHKGRGCPACGKLKSIEESLVRFISKCREVHKDFYDYSLVKESYKSVASDITIVCPVHGIFGMVASSHSAGHGCRKCCTHLTIKDFAERAFEIHGDRYDYSLVNYLGSHTKVEIICKDHGSFMQTPNSHFAGAGCPMCASALRAYDFLTRYTDNPKEGNKEGSIYLLRVVSEKEEFLKVGITTNIKKRMNSYRREKNYTFEIINVWETTRLISAQVESEVLTWKKSNKYHYWPRENFDGRSECIRIDYQEQTIKFIEKLLNK